MPSSVEIVVISLAAATERRRNIRTQFEALTQNWSFFDAHTALQNKDLTYDERDVLRHFGRKFSGPQLAVWSSHYTVIQNFLNNSPHDFLLVFEDDVLFDTNFPLGKVTELCVGKGIDYLRLFGMYYADAEQLSFFYDRALIRYKSSPAGAQAYLLSKAGARKFTETSRNVDVAIDLALDRFWRTGLPIYAVFPFPVIERYSPTSIPILSHQPLNFSDKLAWSVNRVVSKSGKMLENVKLSRADARFRQNGSPFQQVQAPDLDRE